MSDASINNNFTVYKNEGPIRKTPDLVTYSGHYVTYLFKNEEYGNSHEVEFSDNEFIPDTMTFIKIKDHEANSKCYYCGDKYPAQWNRCKKIECQDRKWYA